MHSYLHFINIKDHEPQLTVFIPNQTKSKMTLGKYMHSLPDVAVHLRHKMCNWESVNFRDATWSLMLRPLIYFLNARLILIFASLHDVRWTTVRGMLLLLSKTTAVSALWLVKRFLTWLSIQCTSVSILYLTLAYCSR